jgi:hypothetical protein
MQIPPVKSCSKKRKLYLDYYKVMVMGAGRAPCRPVTSIARLLCPAALYLPSSSVRRPCRTFRVTRSLEMDDDQHVAHESNHSGGPREPVNVHKVMVCAGLDSAFRPLQHPLR